MANLLLFSQPMNMLSDVLAVIEQKYRQIGRLSNQEGLQLRNVRTTAELISDLLQKPVDKIQIEQLTGITFKILQQSSLIHKSPKALLHRLRICERFLDEAHALGWTCPAYLLGLSWRPLKVAIQNRMSSCRQIVEYAIDKGIYAHDFSDDDLDVWRREALQRGLGATYVDHTITWLRLAIRKNGLEQTFPNLNVSLRKAETYVLPLDQIPTTLAQQIQEVQEWALHDPEFAKTPRTTTEIVSAVRELTSFALERGGNIIEIRDAITEHWVARWTDWRKRKVRPKTLEVSLGRLRALVRQHSLFNNGDFGWLDYKIRSVFKEPKRTRRERKQSKLVPHQLLAEVPARIRAERLKMQNPSERDLAWSVHDELFMSIPPWRSANHCGVNIESNIVESEMTDDLWGKIPCVPAWVQTEYEKDEHKIFLLFHFPEDQMKGQKEIWEVMNKDTVDLYRDFRDNHRSKLVCGVDTGSLFLGRDGRAMTRAGLARLIKDISTLYLPKRISHHLRRDCVALGMKIAGATYKEIGAALHHSLNGGESTDEYLVSLPQVNCAGVLEREVATLAHKVGLDFTEKPLKKS